MHKLNNLKQYEVQTEASFLSFLRFHRTIIAAITFIKMNY